jgi:hypothetical protein
MPGCATNTATPVWDPCRGMFPWAPSPAETTTTSHNGHPMLSKRHELRTLALLITALQSRLSFLVPPLSACWSQEVLKAHEILPCRAAQPSRPLAPMSSSRSSWLNGSSSSSLGGSETGGIVAQYASTITVTEKSASLWRYSRPQSLKPFVMDSQEPTLRRSRRRSQIHAAPLDPQNMDFCRKCKPAFGPCGPPGC